MGTSASSLKLRWRGFWWTIPKRVQILLVLLVAAGVVSATGAFLSSAIRSQVVSEFIVNVDPDAGGATFGFGDAFPVAVLGQKVFFTVRLTNPGGTDVLAHVSITAAGSGCSGGGVATVHGTLSTHDACTTPAESDSQTVLKASGFKDFDFDVVYSVATGTYTLTIAALAG